MRNPSILTTLLLFLTAFTGLAQEQTWVVESLSPTNEFVYNLQTGDASGTNGVLVQFGGAILVADAVTVNQKTGEAQADGHVRIQREEQVWVGEHIDYNFKTHIMQTEEFRSGRPPVFASGRGLSGTGSNGVYTATNAVVTSDDFSQPAMLIRARRIIMVPGKYIEARDALLVLDGVPVFYLPYYKRNLGEHANNFTFLPGYRSRFGPFLLGRYDWYWNDTLDGRLHLDERLKRGPGVGPDLNFHLGQWGDASLKYYYLHDIKPQEEANGVSVPKERQRVNFSYWAEPYTNLTLRSQVRYQSDPLLARDFFEGEYGQNPQPNSYVEINKFWRNFSLNTVAAPRVDDFYQSVERLPEVKLTGYRQRLGNTPVYYQSESSFDYLRQRFPVPTNGVSQGLDYEAARADTYQQLLMPHTFFGWLNVTPHAGGRFTYYSQATGPGATNSTANRTVVDTGLRLSFKASRTWADASSKFLDVNGLRHIVEPSADYVYTPKPSRLPGTLPQFDSTLPSLQLQPLEFPGMNAIDSIDSQNAIRYGLRNTLQTKRDGQVVDLLNWEVYTDWRLQRPTDQTNVTSLSDVYSDVSFAPRSWLTFESQTRYDIDQENFRLAYHTVTFQPNNTWSWSLGHYYAHDDAVLGTGNNLITSRIFYRLNENWAVQAGQQFEARTGTFEGQDYTIYRDLRSWTTAFTFRVSQNPGGPTDYTVAITFSLKALPRFALGSDTVRPYPLFGGD
jgi:LPS-assembly protein